MKADLIHNERLTDGCLVSAMFSCTKGGESMAHKVLLVSRIQKKMDVGLVAIEDRR